MAHDEVIYADSKGRLTLGGRPYCPRCLPGNNDVDYEDELTVEEKIDQLTDDKK